MCLFFFFDTCHHPDVIRKEKKDTSPAIEKNENDSFVYDDKKLRERERERKKRRKKTFFMFKKINVQRIMFGCFHHSRLFKIEIDLVDSLVRSSLMLD
jgi:hypothetical protein